MRILVTNDDGVRAPGIAALARAALGTGHDIVVIAPLVDYSGAGAAVGPVHSRDGVDYEPHVIEGLEGVPTYGIDGPPALAVILACVGGFGPRPDLILSGINHGANVGRSALHSGTIGATLTGAHFGVRGLAVSIRYGEEPIAWETPATMAAALVDVLADAPEGTVLNLNAPDLPLSEVRGLRRGALGRAGVIRSAVHAGGDREGHPGGTHHLLLPPFQTGTIRLDLTPAGPTESGLDTDVWLVANDYASVTPLVGVREATGPADAVVDRALGRLGEVTGLGPGPGLGGDHRAAAAS